MVSFLGFRRGLLLLFSAGVVAWLSCQPAAAQQAGQIVRVARIVVDAAQLTQYKAALKEGMETAVRVEPGVLALNAVYEKANPTHVLVLEVYASAAAYQAHLQTPHFKKYKATTKTMVKSLDLVDVEPIALATKAK
ncbi:MAG: putative quinol monooxygenase [Janthinobacterium lividum]